MTTGWRGALGWVARALLAALAVVALRGDAAPVPQVLGADEVRTSPLERAGSRSRRAAAVLEALGLDPGRPVEGASASRELTLRLSADGSVETEEVTVARVGDRVRSGRPALLRSVAPADGQLLVAGTDVRGRVRYAATVPDPLLVRAEFPGHGGEIHGQVIELETATVVVAVPDDPAIVAVKLYRPSADGVVLVGSVGVGR